MRRNPQPLPAGLLAKSEPLLWSWLEPRRLPNSRDLLARDVASLKFKLLNRPEQGSLLVVTSDEFRLGAKAEQRFGDGGITERRDCLCYRLKLLHGQGRNLVRVLRVLADARRLRLLSLAVADGARQSFVSQRRSLHKAEELRDAALEMLNERKPSDGGARHFGPLLARKTIELLAVLDPTRLEWPPVRKYVAGERERTNVGESWPERYPSGEIERFRRQNRDALQRTRGRPETPLRRVFPRPAIDAALRALGVSKDDARKLLIIVGATTRR